jgi:hypothetical protein
MMKWLVSLLLFPISYCVKAQDTLYTSHLKQVNVHAERNWENDTIRYRYNQMKYYVTTILPYLNAASSLFNELNEKINDPAISKKERRVFINTKEDELRSRFENEVSKLNETQGVLLVKLIARQTGVNIYSMLEEFKNPITAIKWQAWAKLHRFNLNKTYSPDDEPMLEHIMINLGYPLPELYGERDPVVLKNSEIRYQTRR